MKLWRLTRAPFVALDGAGPARHGARYTSPGLPVVNFASEAGLAVLVSLRYLPPDLAGIDQDYLLGWTEVEAMPERLPEVTDPAEKLALGDAWLASGRSLLAAVFFSLFGYEGVRISGDDPTAERRCASILVSSTLAQFPNRSNRSTDVNKVARSRSVTR